MNAIVGYSIYGAFALGLAVILVLAFGLVLHAGQHIRNDPLPLIFIAILVAIMASPIASGRVLSAGLFENDSSLEEIASSFWLSRIATLFVMGLCAERILRHFTRKDRAPVTGWPLLGCFVAYAFSNYILNGAFGANPSFDHKALYAFVVYFAVFLSAQSDAERTLRLARTAMLVFMIISAAMVFVVPSMVIERGYSGGLPGLSIRYWGLATHANTMGPVAIAFMICLWRIPYSRPSINVGSWLLALGSLVLTQSKTSVLIGMLIGVFLAAFQYRTNVLRNSPSRRFGFSTATIATACILLAIFLLVFYFGSSLIDPQFRKWDSASGGQISSLTGRIRIWGIAWYEFMTHPVFGYGPSIWGPVYRFEVGAQFASHAHNQLLQSLSSAGLVGGLGLLVYTVVLIVYAFRASDFSGGVSVAFVGLLLLRTFSEVPMAVGQIMQSEFLVHLLALTACVGFAPAKQSATSPHPIHQPRIALHSTATANHRHQMR